jgi:MoaA/NifB/PqqE/SkfB family radical SAM enzyme
MRIAPDTELVQHLEQQRGASVPWQVTWDLTYVCQVRCVMCYQMNLEWKRPAELPTRRIIETIDELSELGTGAILFSGGDPFTRKDFLDIVKRAGAHAMEITVFSSGYAIDEKAAEALAEARVHMVEFTLLGADPESHDVLSRKPGSFKRLVNSVRHLQSAGVPVRAKTVVMRSILAGCRRLLRCAPI